MSKNKNQGKHMDIVIAIISIDWYKLMNYKERVENEKKINCYFFPSLASVGRERQRNKWSNFTFGKALQGEGIEQSTLKNVSYDTE